MNTIPVYCAHPVREKWPTGFYCRLCGSTWASDQAPPKAVIGAIPELIYVVKRPKFKE